MLGEIGIMEIEDEAMLIIEEKGEEVEEVVEVEEAVINLKVTLKLVTT